MLDLTGQTFERFTVIREAEARGSNRRWFCRCACGNERIVQQGSLRNGSSSSCGCLKTIDLTAQSFGTLTVKSLAPNRGSKRCWNCECTCGCSTVVATEALRSGNTRSCRSFSAHFVPMDGQRFSRWLVMREAPLKRRSRRVLCKCDCGAESIVRVSDLNSGWSSSCGCLGREKSAETNRRHGGASRSEYRIWAAMRQRCGNPKNQAYRYYGGRGIKVCKRWASDFVNFYADMGARPKGLTIERIDNSRGYSPDNCKWVSRKEQTRNTRWNRQIKYKGETHCLVEWTELLQIPYKRTSSRLARGWDVARAFTEEVR